MVEASYHNEEYRDFIIEFYYDEDSDSPRNWDPASHIICWDRGYSLGDEHNYEDPRDLFKNLFYKVVPSDIIKTDVLDFIRLARGDARAEFTLYTPDEKENNLSKEDGHCSIHSGYDDWYDEDIDCDSLQDGLLYLYYRYDITDALSNSDLLEFIEKYTVIMPISKYEHSGITVWYGSPNDPWDSGYVGYGYMTKDEVFHEYPDATEDNWKEKAKGLMEAEMETYDTYVRGEVYGYMIEVKDEESFSDNPDIVGENCWGFYGDEGVKDAIEEAKHIIDRYYDSLEDKHIEDIIKGCLDTENA